MTTSHPFLDRLSQRLLEGISDARDELEAVNNIEEVKLHQGRARAYREIQELVKVTAADWLAGDEATKPEP